MFSGTLSLAVRLGAVVHCHSHWPHRLISVRHLHHTAVQNERKREDEGKQSFPQPDMHCESKAKSRAYVHRIVLLRKSGLEAGPHADVSLLRFEESTKSTRRTVRPYPSWRKAKDFDIRRLCLLGLRKP
jgi:hypothetical protein